MVWCGMAVMIYRAKIIMRRRSRKHWGNRRKKKSKLRTKERKSQKIPTIIASNWIWHVFMCMKWAGPTAKFAAFSIEWNEQSRLLIKWMLLRYIQSALQRGRWQSFHPFHRPTFRPHTRAQEEGWGPKKHTVIQNATCWCIGVLSEFRSKFQWNTINFVCAWARERASMVEEVKKFPSYDESFHI